jgi:hypothetical protein
LELEVSHKFIELGKLQDGSAGLLPSLLTFNITPAALIKLDHDCSDFITQPLSFAVVNGVLEFILSRSPNILSTFGHQLAGHVVGLNVQTKVFINHAKYHILLNVFVSQKGNIYRGTGIHLRVLTQLAKFETLYRAA